MKIIILKKRIDDLIYIKGYKKKAYTAIRGKKQCSQLLK
jgi:hypothetical protein